MATLRERGCQQFGVLGTSYGGWIGRSSRHARTRFSFCRAYGADHERRARDLGEPCGTVYSSRTVSGNIEPALVAVIFISAHRCTITPCATQARVLFIAGDFDSIARPEHVEAIQQNGTDRSCCAFGRAISATA